MAETCTPSGIGLGAAFHFADSRVATSASSVEGGPPSARATAVSSSAIATTFSLFIAASGKERRLLGVGGAGHRLKHRMHRRERRGRGERKLRSPLRTLR